MDSQAFTGTDGIFHLACLEVNQSYHGNIHTSYKSKSGSMNKLKFPMWKECWQLWVIATTRPAPWKPTFMM